MARHRLALSLLAALAVAAASTPVSAQSAPPPAAAHGLEVYTGTVSAEAAAALQQQLDHDFQVVRTLEDGTVEVAVVLTRVAAAKLRRDGVTLQLSRDARGRTATQAADAKSRSGYEVFRPYSGPGGLRQEIQALHAKHPQTTKLVVIGQSVQGKPILALKVTEDAKRVPDGSRPAALYLGTQHAREWIAPEVTRRLMRWFVEEHADGDQQLRRLLAANEYWFIPVANPDGYDHTFTDGNRLWRKNLRDNDGDGQITAARDGVDLNRNLPTHWGYDDEGSSSNPSSGTYRGTAPASEPETQALDALMARIGFNFVVNYHSAAELLLYGVGWQRMTPTPDDLVHRTLTGDDANPAVQGFDPDLSSELYTTNGETRDHAHAAHGSIAFTPELSNCTTVAEPSGCESRFNFPDDETKVQAEFDKNKPFALDVAESTADPANPVSHLGNRAPAFQTDPFAVSYGTPQPVAVWAARRLGPVTLHYRVNGGPAQSGSTSEWQGGERYGDDNDVHYREVRGTVPTGSPGDAVEVWFTAGGETSGTFTYTVASDTGRDVLILAAEDYTGAISRPAYRSQTSPNYLDAYRTALDDSGIEADEYDVDARGRTAPHHLGVLGHYDAVLWYSGNDSITRMAGGRRGTASKLASDLEVSVRDYLNEGGKVVVTGRNFGAQQTNGLPFNPAGEPPECPVQPEECLALSDDFLQYYLGAYKHNWEAGTLAVTGQGPLDGLVLGLDGTDSARNQGSPSSLLATSDFLPRERYPRFTSGATMRYHREGGAPYEPRSGTTYAFSQTADVSFKRLTRTVQVPADGDELSFSFWVSADTENRWDYVAVEARTVGQDDWTTLPDRNGLSSQGLGESCAAGWRSLHPWLDRYQTFHDGSCTPTGTTGTWHAFTGNSHGWKQWVADLSAYRGKQVELSISYISDWASQGLGVFVDDIAVPGEPVQDLEAGLGAWTVPGAPAGSSANPNDWISSGTAFEEGAAVRTEDTYFFGFGIEGVTGRQQRAELVRRALADLLQR